MSDLQSRFLRCAALTKAPANFSGLPWRSHPPVSTNQHISLYIQMKICNQSTLSSHSNIFIRKQFIFGLWTSASTSDSVLLISILFHWKQLYIPRHKNRINNPKKKKKPTHTGTKLIKVLNIWRQKKEPGFLYQRQPHHTGVAIKTFD